MKWSRVPKEYVYVSKWARCRGSSLHVILFSVYLTGDVSLCFGSSDLHLAGLVYNCNIISLPDLAGTGLVAYVLPIMHPRRVIVLEILIFRDKERYQCPWYHVHHNLWQLSPLDGQMFSYIDRGLHMIDQASAVLQDRQCHGVEMRCANDLTLRAQYGANMAYLRGTDLQSRSSGP